VHCAQAGSGLCPYIKTAKHKAIAESPSQRFALRMFINFSMSDDKPLATRVMEWTQ
jgi:hypothetical protein